jgi:hypothetical protein
MLCCDGFDARLNGGWSSSIGSGCTLHAKVMSMSEWLERQSAVAMFGFVFFGAWLIQKYALGQDELTALVWGLFAGNGAAFIKIDEAIKRKGD